MELFYTQERAKREIEELLLKSNIVCLYGKSGVGKSSLIKEYCANEQKVVVLTEYSNNSYRNSNMQNFKLAMSDSKFKFLPEDKTTFIEAIVQDLPVAKSSFSYVIGSLKNKAVNRLDTEYFKVFNEDEKSIIMKIVSITNKKPLLLVFDNYHWANINDVLLINKLCKICDNDKLFHNSIKIIVIATINQNENPDFEISELLVGMPSVNLDQIAVEHYSEILNLMGLKEPLPERIVSTIYSMTSGHLELTQKVIEYINVQGLSSFYVNEDIEEKALSMMMDIFGRMIKCFFKEGQSTIDLLEIASVIGNFFNQYELKALTKEEIFLIEKHLNNAVGGHFIEIDKDGGRFIHPIIRELFYKKLDDKRYTYHKKYAFELKRLKPTEHLERAFHFEICKESASALHEAITAYFIHVLDGLSFSDSVYQKIKVNVRSQKLEKYFINLEQALKYYVLGQIKDSLECLDKIDDIDITTEYYGALKDYMYAKDLLLYKYDTNSFIKSAELLKKAGNCFLKLEEFELYINTLLILLNIYAYKLCDVPAAKNIEKQIIELFRKELNECLDSKIEDYRYEYKRKSVSICAPEIAYKRAKEAFEYFKNSSNVIASYKSACDYSATCIFMGRFNEALSVLEFCGHTVGTYRIIMFPEAFKLQNNYILASLCLNPIAFQEHVQEAIEVYENILLDNPYITKIVNINLAGMFLLEGRYSEADKELHRLENELTEYKSVLYNTFIYGNLASLNILKQNYSQALKYLDLVDAHISDWEEDVRLYYKEQAKILRQLAQEEEKLTPQQLFMRPLAIKPEHAGSSWNFIGHGILFSELLFYTT